MTRHPRALEARRDHPAGDTHRTAVTTAANKVRDHVTEDRGTVYVLTKMQSILYDIRQRKLYYV